MNSSPRRARRRFYAPQVLALALAMLGAADASRAQEAPEATSWPEGARVSLELKRAPLTDFLAALEAQSGLKVRLATIPDVEVSVSLENAPLQQAVRDVLALHGFDLKAGPGAFWLVTSPRTEPAQGALGGESWRWWTGPQPPARWMAPEEEGTVAYEGPASVSGVPGLAPYGVRVRLQALLPSVARWRAGVRRFQGPTPGVVPAPSLALAPSPRGESASSTWGARWCARWPLALRSVPSRCLLVIESDRPASLYLNGSRLLRGWAGRRTVDVSGALVQGQNLIALEWLPPSAQGPQESPAPGSAPSVRYEWIVAQ